MKMKKFITFFLLTLFVYQNTFAGAGHDHGGGESSGTTSKYPIVTVSKAQKAEKLEISVEASGKILAKNTSDIFASREGIISELRVDLGDYVNKGDILAILSPDRDQSVLLAELSVKSKELEVAKERYELLTKGDLVPIQSEINTAKKNLEATEKENQAEAEQIAAQIKILSSRRSVKEFAFQKGIQEALSVFADFLFKNSSFLEKDTITNPSAFRRSDFFNNNSIARSQVAQIEPRFIDTYSKFKKGDIDINEVLTLGKKFKTLSNQAQPSVASQDDFEKIDKELTEVLDHLSEILTEDLELENEIKTLETDKKRLLISSEQRKVMASNDLQSLENKKDFSSQELEWGKENLETEIGAIRKQLGFGAYVRAPFSGKVTKRHLNVGDSVSGDRAIYSLVEDAHKFVRFFVAESELPFIKQNKEIVFAPTFSPSQKFPARIARISPSIDAETGTILVEADLLDPQETVIEAEKTSSEDIKESETNLNSTTDNILVNMSVRVQIPVFDSSHEDKNLIAVPEKALEVSQSFFGDLFGKNQIWVVNSDVEAEKYEVQVEFIYDGWAFVSNNLTGKEWVIVKSPVKLKSHLEVDTKLVP